MRRFRTRPRRPAFARGYGGQAVLVLESGPAASWCSGIVGEENTFTSPRAKSNAPASPPPLPEKHNAVDDRQDKDYAHQASDLANIAAAALG